MKFFSPKMRLNFNSWMEFMSFKKIYEKGVIIRLVAFFLHLGLIGRKSKEIKAAPNENKKSF